MICKNLRRSTYFPRFLALGPGMPGPSAPISGHAAFSRLPWLKSTPSDPREIDVALSSLAAT